MDNEIKILEHGGICRTLVFYLNHPDGILRIKYREEPLKLSSKTAKRVHDLLYENELIENLPNKEQLLFRLTEKGKKIAGELKIINSILREK